MIASSNFVAIDRLVVLARKDPGITSPFSCLLDPVTLTCILFSPRAERWIQGMNVSSVRAQQVCYQLQGKSNCVLVVFFSLSCMPESFLQLETTTLSKHVSVLVPFLTNIKVLFSAFVYSPEMSIRPKFSGPRWWTNGCFLKKNEINALTRISVPSRISALPWGTKSI